MVQPTDPASPPAGGGNPPTPPTINPRSVQNINNILQEQLRIVAQLNEAIAEMSASLTRMDTEGREGALNPEHWRDLRAGIDDATDAAEGGQGVLAKLKSAFSKVGDMIMGPLKGAFGFFGDSLKFITALGGNFLSFLGDAVSGLFNLSMAIISVPFKILSKLFEMAANFPVDNSYAKALQAIVKSFGDINSVGPKAIKTVAKNMDQFTSDGRSAFLVWGNLAQRTEATLKFAEELGPQFERNAKDIEKNGEMYMRFQRGMALTGEAMQAVFQRAETMGKKPQKLLTEMHKQASALGKQFNIDAKIISKEMGKALQDLAHFGHLGAAEMGVAATYSARLGTSVEKLVGIMDQTLTFDQAAEAAAKLNEQFHTNIEAMDLLNAKGPADILDVYRQGFAEAGVDMAKMDWRTRQFVKTTTGMSDELFEAAASGKNMSITAASIRKEAEKAEKSIKSETQAVKELNKSIDMMVPEPGQMPKSLIEGIMEGIDRSFKLMPEFRGLFMNIRAILKESIFFGKKIGDVLQELPGLRDIIGGLQDIFNPSHWHAMFDKLLVAFKKFTANGYKDIDTFVTDIKDSLLGLFGDSAPGAQRLWAGVKTFFTFLESLVRRGISYVLEKIAEGISFMADWLPSKITELLAWIENPTKKLDLGLKTPGVVSEWAKIFDPLFPAMEKFRMKAWPELKKLFSYLFNELMTWAQKNLGSLWSSPTFWAFLAGPAVIQAVAGPAMRLGVSIAKSLAGKFIATMAAETAATGAATATQAAAASGGGIMGALSKLGPLLANPYVAVGVAATAIIVGAFTMLHKEAMSEVDKLQEKLENEDYLKDIEDKSKTIEQKIRTAQEQIVKQGQKYDKLHSMWSRDSEEAELAEQRKKEAEKNLDELMKLKSLEDHADIIMKDLARPQGLDADPTKYGFENSPHGRDLLGERVGELLNKKLQEEQAKAAAEKKQRTDAMKQQFINSMGLEAGEPIDVDKFKTYVTNIDKFSREFDKLKIDDKMQELRKKISSVDFTIMEPHQEQKLVDTAYQVNILVKMFKDLGEIGDSLKAAKDSIDKMVDALGDPSGGGSFFKALGSEGYLKLIVALIRDTFVSMSTNIEGIAEGANAATAALSTVSTFAQTASDAVVRMKDAVKELSEFQQDPKIATTIKNAAIPGFSPAMEAIVKAINDMIVQTKKVDTALSNMPALNLAAKLKPIADGMGFGGKFAYNVQGGTVKVEVNLNVHMDAADLETKLIMRKTSFVRDRINFALQNSTNGESAKEGLLDTTKDPAAVKLTTVN